MSLPSIEVLEAHHSFPGPYMFKVIGVADDRFTGRVVEQVRDELGLDQDPPYTLRNTAKGNHVAITLEPECESPQQVLTIYNRLTGLDGMVMLL
ncbi:MAG: DUF493 domain-containing protein [Fuerstiella sp.]|nr:DUF493 domain-containing protein [Fuerstiella sp.]